MSLALKEIYDPAYSRAVRSVYARFGNASSVEQSSFTDGGDPSLKST